MESGGNKQEKEKEYFQFEGMNIPVISLEELKSEKSEIITNNPEKDWYGSKDSGGYVGKDVAISKILVIHKGEPCTLINKHEEFYNESDFRHNYDDYDRYPPQDEFIVVDGVTPEQITIKKELIHEDERVLRALQFTGYPTASEGWTDDYLEIKSLSEKEGDLEFDDARLYGEGSIAGLRGWRKRIIGETEEAVVTQEYWVNQSDIEDRERYVDTITVYLK